MILQVLYNCKFLRINGNISEHKVMSTVYYGLTTSTVRYVQYTLSQFVQYVPGTAYSVTPFMILYRYTPSYVKYQMLSLFIKSSNSRHYAPVAPMALTADRRRDRFGQP